MWLEAEHNKFDLLIATYIFSEIPSADQRPDIYEITEMSRLKKRIDSLLKIARPLSIGFGIFVVILLICLNVFEK
jgi:hypothetical protein